MKKYYGNYLGLCINNDDPQKRGRVQVFIPHIMPALYKDWNEAGEDIKLICVGDNLPDSLPASVVEKLMKILPWAESASPILGTSSPGNLITNALNAVGEAISTAAGAVSNYFNPSPVAAPAGGEGGNAAANADEQSLFNNAAKYGPVGSSKFSRSGSADGNCGRGSRQIIGALTNNSYFSKGIGGTGSFGGVNSAYAGSLSTGNPYLQNSGYYNSSTNIPSNYTPQIGDVITGTKAGGAGHVQVYIGNGKWVSDHTQGSYYSSYGNLKLHRMNGAGLAAVQKASPGLFGASGGASASSTTSVDEKNSPSGTAAAPTPHQDENSVQTDTEQNNYGNIARPDVSNQTTASDLNTASLSLTNSHKQGLSSFLQNYQQNKSQYEAVSEGLKQNGITMKPSQVAAIHWREASGSFSKSIANGQSLGTYVRKDGRMGNGSASNSYTPTNNWSQHSIDVLTHKVNQKYGGARDVSSSTAFNDFAERFNGLGYRNKGKVSPYVYAGTNQYTGGKYTADGVYDSSVFDKQVGTAVLAAAAEGTLETGGIAATALPPGATEGDGSSTSASAASQSLVQNTDKHGAMAVLNINNMAKGVFTYPAAGAMLWVFFREGDPNFPVYFAANYGEREWASAFRLGSDGAAYKPAKNADNDVTSTGGVMNLNGVGGMRWEDTNVPSDPTKDQKSLTLFGYDGSNMHFNEGYHQIFSKFDRRDSVEGDRWETTLGFKEEWVQGDSNEVTMGDVFVKIGNVSPPAVDAVTRIQQIIKECMEPVTQSSGSSSSTSTAGKSEYTKAAADTSKIKSSSVTSTPKELTATQEAALANPVAFVRDTTTSSSETGRGRFNARNSQTQVVSRQTYEGEYGTAAQRQAQESAARAAGL